MAVVPRKRAGRIVYGVVTSWRGAKYWELVGPNRRDAESVDALRKREIKAGTYRPGEVTDAASVKVFAEGWLEKRKNRSADNDRALVRQHVLSVGWFASMRLADVRPRHILKLIGELNAGHLAPKSVALVMGVVRVMFRDAVIDDVLAATPYVVPRGTLTRGGQKRQPYTVAEAQALIEATSGERERMWNALAFYTGARCGEVCGLRWGDWDQSPTPLGCLSVERQYDGQVLKTERARKVPVHRELARLLAAWRERWSLFFLRRPGPGDLIVPRLVTGEIEPLTKNAAYKAWIRSCKAANVTNRSVHSTRHTFISVARRGGAEKELVELVTHNPKGTIVDAYTTREWSELCSAVLAVSFDVHRSAHPVSGSGGEKDPSGHPELPSVSQSARVSADSYYFESRLWSRNSRGVDDQRLTARRIEVAPVDALALAAQAVLGRGRVHRVKLRRKGARRAG